MCQWQTSLGSSIHCLSSGTFHHGSLDDNACGHIFPERYEQLARQRHDCRLLKTAAIAPDPFFKPQGQRRVRLMALYCGPVLRHPTELMLPAVDLGGRVWLGSKPCKGGPAAPAFGG